MMINSRRRQISCSDARRLRGCSVTAVHRGVVLGVRTPSARRCGRLGVVQEYGELSAIVEVKFAIETAHVVAHGLLAELQLSGDLSVVGSLRDHPGAHLTPVGSNGWVVLHPGTIAPPRCREPDHPDGRRPQRPGSPRARSPSGERRRHPRSSPGERASRDWRSKSVSWLLGTPKREAAQDRCRRLVRAPDLSRRRRQTPAMQSAEQLRLALGDLDDVDAIVLAEKPSQSKTEQPFSDHQDHGDLCPGDRRAIRGRLRS